VVVVLTVYGLQPTDSVNIALLCIIVLLFFSIHCITYCPVWQLFVCYVNVYVTFHTTIAIQEYSVVLLCEFCCVQIIVNCFISRLNPMHHKLHGLIAVQNAICRMIKTILHLIHVHCWCTLTNIDYASLLNSCYILCLFVGRA